MSKDEAYQKEYSKWFNSLTLQEQAELKAKGLDKPLNESSQTYKADPDPVFAQLSIFDTLEEDEEEQEQLKPNELIYMLSFVMSRVKSLLDIDTFIVALGLNLLNGTTQTQLAIKHKITRSAFSLHVKEWQRILSLNPSQYMRNSNVCKTYHNTQKGIYARGERRTTHNQQNGQVSRMVSKEERVREEGTQSFFEEFPNP